MKAIATLAVLGLAFAGETRENPRFRIDRKVFTANNNKDVIALNLNKDLDNIPGVRTTITSHDLNDLIPASLRDYVKNVQVEEKVFEAKNNNGVININMDDADDEFFLDFTHKGTNVNANHNSGFANINIHNDDEFMKMASNQKYDHDLSQINGSDDELAFIAPEFAVGGKYYHPYTHDDELFLDVHHQSTRVNANHNSGMMNIGIDRDDADNELRTTVSANDNNGMMMIMGHDDEMFLDIHHQSTNVNANHNSGFANINIHNDDADNELTILANLLRNQ